MIVSEDKIWQVKSRVYGDRGGIWVCHRKVELENYNLHYLFFSVKYCSFGRCEKMWPGFGKTKLDVDPNSRRDKF